jgi:hypothetical protein
MSRYRMIPFVSYDSVCKYVKKKNVINDNKTFLDELPTIFYCAVKHAYFFVKIHDFLIQINICEGFLPSFLCLVYVNNKKALL